MMTNEKKMELLAEILDVDVEEVIPEKRLDEFTWDSIAILSFMAMMDEEFGKEVKGSEVKKLVTVQDAFDMMEE